MHSILKDLKPEPNDLVVVPHETEVPEGLPFLVHKIKFLLTPSIIRSGGNTMDFFEKMSPTKILNWLTGKAEVPGTQQNEQHGQNHLEPRTVVGKGKETDSLPQFYRYSRPLDPRNDFTLGPKGGVTFFIELDVINKTLVFSYALCHNDDRFNRKTARHIAKQRFDLGDWYEIKNYDPDLSTLTNIRNAINSLLSAREDSKADSIQFSSVSERINEYELNMIFERI